MSNYNRFKKDSIGLSPYAIKFRGLQRTEQTQIRLTYYLNQEIEELEITQIDEALPYLKREGWVWVNIDGLHDEALMQKISDVFNINPMMMSDIMQTEARPRVYELDDDVLITSKMVEDESISGIQLTAENLSIILKKKLVLTFQEHIGDVFDPVRDRIRKHSQRFSDLGSAYLIFTLLDIVIDHYNYILSELGERIESNEEQLSGVAKKSVLMRINRFKKDIIFLRRAIRPTRDMVINLLKLDSDVLPDEIRVHYRELLDNINNAYESIESYSEVLNDQFNTFNTHLNNRLNDVIKFLTMFSTVFIPATFIAGVYGTNFDHIPELHWRYGYFAMWALMIVVVLGMLWYFKRKKWM